MNPVNLMKTIIFLAGLGLVWVFANRFAGTLATKAGV